MIWSRLREASKRDGAVAKEVGRVDDVFGQGDVVTAEYEMPLLAHATMEPLNCTVHITPTSAEAWTGTQVMARVQAAVAKAANLPASQVTVHNHLLGGGFGRRLEPDMVLRRCTRSRSKSRVRSKSCGRGKKTSGTTTTVPRITRSSRRAWRAIASSAGSTRYPALPSSRAGCRRPFRKASIPTASTPRSTFPTTFPTIASSSTAKSRRASTRLSGAAWVRTTMCSRSSRSSTSWRAGRARIRSPSGALTSTRCRACRRCSIS